MTGESAVADKNVHGAWSAVSNGDASLICHRLPDGSMVAFHRPRGNAIWVSVQLPLGWEHELSREKLPSIVIDGDVIFDGSSHVRFSKYASGINLFYVSKDYSECQLWGGEKFSPIISKLFEGQSATLIVNYENGLYSNYNFPLGGFRDAFIEIFGDIPKDVSVVAPTMDRNAIRSMAEDSWRALLAIDPRSHVALNAAIERSNAHVTSIARTMPQPQQDAFVRAFTEERQILIDEQQRDPAGLRRRLGVGDGGVAVTYREEGIGRMAAKTAVRAGIWAAIWSIFFN